MPPEQIQMLKEFINQRFVDMEKYLDSRFETNDKCHEKFDDHFKILNGQTRRNTIFRKIFTAFISAIIILIPLYLKYVN